MSRKHVQSPAPEEDAHGWASAVDRFPVDTLLRRHGFEIHERRRGQEAVWKRDGVAFCQSEALDKLPKSERKKLADKLVARAEAAVELG